VVVVTTTLSLIGNCPLRIAQKELSNGIWKSENGLLDQKLEHVVVTLGKPGKQRK